MLTIVEFRLIAVNFLQPPITNMHSSVQFPDKTDVGADVCSGQDDVQHQDDDDFPPYVDFRKRHD